MTIACNEFEDRAAVGSEWHKRVLALQVVADEGRHDVRLASVRHEPQTQQANAHVVDLVACDHQTCLAEAHCVNL